MDNQENNANLNSKVRHDESETLNATPTVVIDELPSEKQIVMNKIFGIDEEADKKISKRRKIFKRIFTALFILFVVGVLVGTAINDFFTNRDSTAPIKDIGLALEQNWYYIIFAFLSIFFCLVFRGVERSTVCKALTKKFYPKVSFETGLIGQMYNYITPLSMGGQPFEVYYLSKHGLHGGQAASVPIATYLVNQMAGLFVGIMSVIIYQNNWFNFPSLTYMPKALYVLAIVGLSLAAIIPFLIGLFSFLPRLAMSLIRLVAFLGGKLKLIKDPKTFTYNTSKSVLTNAKCLKFLVKKPLLLIFNFLMSCGEQLALVSVAYFTLRALGFDWPAPGFTEWAQIVVLCLIINSAVSFFPTPGSSGAADLSFYLLFSKELPAGLAFPAMIVWRFISFYFVIILGFAVLRKRKKQDNLQNFSDKEFK